MDVDETVQSLVPILVAILTAPFHWCVSPGFNMILRKTSLNCITRVVCMLRPSNHLHSSYITSIIKAIGNIASVNTNEIDVSSQVKKAVCECMNVLTSNRYVDLSDGKCVCMYVCVCVYNISVSQ